MTIAQVTVWHKERRSSEVVAAGGRYDRLIESFAKPTLGAAACAKAVGVNIVLDKLVELSVLATPAPGSHTVLPTSDATVLVCHAPRSPELLPDMLSVVSELWAAGIAAVTAGGSVAGSTRDELQAAARALGMEIIVMLPDKYSSRSPVLTVRDFRKKKDMEVARSALPETIKGLLSKETLEAPAEVPAEVNVIFDHASLVKPGKAVAVNKPPPLKRKNQIMDKGTTHFWVVCGADVMKSVPQVYDSEGQPHGLASPRDHCGRTAA